MKRRLAAALLACLVPALAIAAPPTAADVDAMMTAMDLKQTAARMIDEIETPMLQSVNAAAAGARPEDRARIEGFVEQVKSIVRDEVRWSRMEPIYRRVYMQVLTQEEVRAVTAFYSTPVGRGVMQKMPAAMGQVMGEIQPILRSLDQRIQSAQALAFPPTGDGDEPTGSIPATPPAPPAPPAGDR